MELCTPKAFSNLPNHKLISSNQAHLQWRPSLLLKKPSKSRFNPGLFCQKGSAIRSKSETEAYELYVPPTVEEKDEPYELYVPPTVEEKDNGAFQNEAPIEDSRNDKETDAYASLIYEPPKAEEKDDGAVQNEAPVEDSRIENEALIYEPPKIEEEDNGAVQTEPNELYVPPTVEEKENGAVQNEAPIEDSINDKDTDAYEPPKVERKDDGAVQNEAPIDDSRKDKETLIYEPPKIEEDNGAVQAEAPIEDSALEFESQLSKFFGKLNIKYDPEDSSSIILFGGTAVTALWLATAIVGAVDSIPLLPKLLEVVGLGYTVWFSTRFLLFKENRDELAAKIEDLKKEVLGSKYD